MQLGRSSVLRWLGLSGNAGARAEKFSRLVEGVEIGEGCGLAPGTLERKEKVLPRGRSSA